MLVRSKFHHVNRKPPLLENSDPYALALHQTLAEFTRGGLGVRSNDGPPELLHTESAVPLRWTNQRKPYPPHPQPFSPQIRIESDQVAKEMGPNFRGEGDQLSVCRAGGFS